jgi:hypothetical protein
MKNNKKIDNGAKKTIDNGAEKAIDSGAEKPIDNRAEQTINDQDKPEITMEYLMILSRNSMVAQNTHDMAKLTLDDKAKDNIPRDKTGNIDCSNIKFDPGFIPPPPDIKKRLEQLRGYLDPNDPWYQPEYLHINIRALIKLYEEGLIDGTHQIYIQYGKLVSREQSFKAPAITEGVFHQYAQERNTPSLQL